MRKINNAGNIVDAVSGSSTRPERLCAHIHGIGAMLDCLNGNIGISGRSKKLNATWCSSFHTGDRVI